MPRRMKGSAQADFGARMAALRKAAGYTQQTLGIELGISQRMVAYYEGQTDYPPSGILPKLAHALGVTTDELLGAKPVTQSGAKATESKRLWRRFKQIEKLPPKDRRQVLQLIEILIEKENLRNGTSG